MKLPNRDRKGVGARAFFASMIFCGVALADLSETTFLQTNTALNLETGAVAGSGGDILWDGSAITPQGQAKAFNIGLLGLTNFAGLSASYFTQLAAAARSAPIPPGKLVPGDACVVVTNGGHTAKVLVLANSGGSITLQFTVFGISPPAGVRLVTHVDIDIRYIDAR